MSDTPPADRPDMPWLQAILDTLPSPVLLLDRGGRIVFANHALLTLIDTADQNAVRGKRLGEALDCRNARECDCGAAEACDTCGAAKTIFSMTRHDTSIVEECRISRHDNCHPLDFRVHTVPLPGPDPGLFLLHLTDISHEKRRRVLERIFFHDVMNLTHGMAGMSRLLCQRQLDATKQQRFTEALYRQATRLAAEVEAQRDLAAAENNELLLNPQPCSSAALLEELATFFGGNSLETAQVVVDPSTADIGITVDQRLLLRILGNMIKNAVEASSKEEVVLIGCKAAGTEGVLYWVQNQGYIPREIQLQIFQRSFSTKGDGRGLGTYSIKMLGERYLKGRVSFSSCTEHGTIFRFQCPTCPAAIVPTTS